MTSDRIALFGGVYSNHLALAATLDDIARRGLERAYCLGDLGAFGPHPDRVFPLLIDRGVTCIQGNYDHSIGNRLDDCACGYTDPRDNYFARISFDYTATKTGARWKDWLRELPPSLDLDVGGHAIHLCHGSPRQTNEFLWESTTPDPFLRRFDRERRYAAIAFTHTGLHWQRQVDDTLFLNVGVIGRPENDGTTSVTYSIVTAEADSVRSEQVRVAYDHERLAEEMRAEGLPEEFIDTVLEGWWKSCLEVMPGKERARGRY